MFSVGSNIQELARRNLRRIQDLRSGVLKVEHESARQMLLTAQRLSSGQYRRAQLARMAAARGGGLKGVGLYSRRAPAPPQDIAILNMQSGQLYRSWRYSVTWRAGGDGTGITLWNTAPYARFLAQGTATSIGRPLILRLQQIEGPAHTARLARAKSLGLKGR